MTIYPKKLFTLLLVSLFLIASHSTSSARTALASESIAHSAIIFPAMSKTLIYSEQKVSNSDGNADDQFGYSVALSGDTALVGAYNKNNATGAAYIFVRSGTTWIQQATLTAEGGRPGDRFGYSVALSGDTALVGADEARIGSNDYQGAAYVFVRSGVNWTQQAKLTADDGAQFDRFGVSVALSGDTALVGVPYDEVGSNMTQGSVYVFSRQNSVWSQKAHLTAEDGGAADWFGYTLVLSGNTALVGAPVADIGSQTNQGAAYVFTLSGANWAQAAKLTLAEGAEEDRFGYAVALAGDTALISAVNVNSGHSAAYVFIGGGSSWSRQTQWTVAGGEAFDNFGQAVSLAGNTALVGARPPAGLGSAYLFTRSGNTWLQRAQLFASDGTLDDQYGFSVALSGGWGLVGAPHATVSSKGLQGAAYFYHLLTATYLPLVVN